MEIKKKINAKFDDIFDFLSMKSSSKYGYIVRNLRIQSFYNNQFMYHDYITKMRNFYQSEAVVYCQNNNLLHINELLLRRKELKNQKNYLLSIGVGIGTGVPVGLFVNNINKFGFLLGKPDDGIIPLLFKFIFVVGLMLSIIGGVFAVLGIFKYFSSDTTPLMDYSEEEELRIIEEEINKIVNIH
ncbi:hypothetical protein [Paenibacillus lautus]|uniref:hypothetical protein n=1 Tax=Paenibacillus lautus TaxID=1401 RepID=UPI003D272108